MFGSEYPVGVTILRIVALSASLFIGFIILLESQFNAVNRRTALISAAQGGETRAFFGHSVAFILNLLFLWVIQVTLVTLATKLFGWELNKLATSKGYIWVTVTMCFPLIIYTLLGRRMGFRSSIKIS